MYINFRVKISDDDIICTMKDTVMFLNFRNVEIE